MKSIFGSAILFFIIVSTVSYAQEPSSSCSVTYIANEGFLAETAKHKVLFDALFGGIKGNWCEQPGDSILNLMTAGNPPFDKVNITFVSHRHADHFKEKPVIDFLKNNKNSVLICPEQVNEILMKNSDYNLVSGRITAINSLDTLLKADGITVRAMKFNHGSYFETDTATGQKYDLHKNVQNYCYFVESEGFTILHTGDCSTSEIQRFEELELKNKSIDIAFFGRTFLKKEGMEIINGLNLNNIVFMHIEPGRTEYYKSFVKDIPQITIFDGKSDKKGF
ncbi:MAG: MBL fold metallo-hydrolase [Ignavibacteria bacterium]|nr:MBL fold metallo-hydrolase [Ignavibacteria bacterium]